MGYKAIEAVIAHSCAKGPPYHLLLVIAHRINDDDGLWSMSVADLQRDARMRRRQVHAALAELRAVNEITVKRTGRKSVYSTPLYVPSSGAENRTSDMRESAHQDEKRSTENRTSDMRESAHLKGGNPHISTYRQPITTSYIPKGAENGSISRPTSPDGRGTPGRGRTPPGYPEQPDWTRHGKYAWAFTPDTGESDD